MRVAGLFAGIGGFEIGLAQAGHVTVLTCESDAAASAVLRARMPEVPNHGDIRTLKSLPSEADLICAGFPCQDLSQAGQTAGISGLRSGLIGEVFRLLENRAVPWLVLENVSFMLHLQQGRALKQIVEKLEALGYRWAYRVVNSLAFLPQRRERVFLVASTEGDPADVLLSDEAVAPRHETRLGTIAHGFYWTEGIRGLGWAPDAVPTLKNGSTIGIPSSPAILMPDGAIIKPDLRDAERLQGFPEGWTEPARQVKRTSFGWSLVGNAVSVPVSEWLGRRLAEPGRYDRARDCGLPKDGRWPKAARFDGVKRHQVLISSAPVWEPRPHLHEFLRHRGTPLSVKATAGFSERTTRSRLRFPEGFLAAVAAHLNEMRIIESAKGSQTGGRWSPAVPPVAAE